MHRRPPDAEANTLLALCRKLVERKNVRVLNGCVSIALSRYRHFLRDQRPGGAVHWLLTGMELESLVLCNGTKRTGKQHMQDYRFRLDDRRGKMLRFECLDSGPGIPKQDESKLFQRFVQCGGAPGTGLGLAIAKHLVGLVGGSIAESRIVSVEQDVTDDRKHSEELRTNE